MTTTPTPHLPWKRVCAGLYTANVDGVRFTLTRFERGGWRLNRNGLSWGLHDSLRAAQNYAEVARSTSTDQKNPNPAS